jgi:hypothetical protein
VIAAPAGQPTGCRGHARPSSGERRGAKPQPARRQDVRQEPHESALADSISRGLATDVATSALPDAPVRTQRTTPTPRKHAPAARLRRRSASLLIGLAGRLDPSTPTVG